MRRSGRKWLSLLLALCMVVTMLPAMSIPVAAAGQQFTDGQEIDAQTITDNTTWNIPQGVTVSVQGQITVNSGATLTLTGGGTIQRAAEYTTGPLFAVGGTLTATGVVMDGQNIAADYAAIFTQNTGSKIVLNNVTLQNFKSSGFKGGALCMGNGGEATLTNCTIQNNSATSYGGAIYAGDNVALSITGGTISTNQTTNTFSTYGGGALYIRTAVVSLNNVTFSQNTSTRGGAIYNSSYGTLTITGGSISGNTATESEYENSAGIYHSSRESGGGVLNLNGDVRISDPIYLDSKNASKVVILQSALQYPLTLYCADAGEGRVVIEGDTNYTVTAQDMARLSMKNNGWYFGLSGKNNQIFLTALESEAYIPIIIQSDDDSLNVTLKQNGQTVALDYSETADGYIGSVPAGTYDVYVDGTDTGNNITVSVNNTVFGPEVLMHHSHPICGDSSCQEHGGAVSFYALTSLNSTLTQGNYYLTSDLINNTGNDIAISGAVNLCLNGQTLNLNGHHIKIEGSGNSLTLCDCGTIGEITGGSGEHGGAIYVNGGTLTLYSGTITGNTANGNGGGVYVLNGSFTMSGGSISDNTATQAESGGGGIFVTGASSSFTMSGSSSISNNMASGRASRGGGIYLPSGTFTMSDNASVTNNTASNGGGVFTDGTFTMTGGTITGNTAISNGGGVYVYTNGSFSISGAPTVTNNTRSSDNTGNNVLLLKNKTIGITNPLTSGKIGVTMETLGVFTSGWGDHMGNDAPNEYFTSDSGTYLVMLNNDSREVMLHKHSYTYSGSGGDTVITETCAGCGHSATAAISIRDDADLTYTGSAITPAQVTYSDDWQGGDLTITYSNNTNVGTATATITKDNATASVTFMIGKANQTLPTASEYSIDYFNEKITSIASGCKVYTAQDASTEVAAGSPISNYLGGNLYIRWEETDNYHASGWTTISLTPRPTAPNITAAAETIKGKGDGKVTGVTTAMEYSTDGGQNWMPCAGAEITDFAAGTAVLVRVKATSSAPHGEAASCAIGASENTLTVIFEENGGSAVTEITGLSYNAAISAPTEPTKTGYTFAGWYREAACTTLWDFSSDKVTDDITLYAKWTPAAYSITYHLDGGASENPTSYTVETASFTLNNPTRTGYTFAGWTGTGLGEVTESVTIQKGSTGDRTYTATWTANSYTVSFNANADAVTGSMNAQTFTYDHKQALTANAFTRTGYTFAGWDTAADGSGVKYTDQQEVENLSATDGATITLYAQWTANSNTAYTVQHWQQNLNGGNEHNDTNYTLTATENLTGTTGAGVTPAVKFYEGFTAPSTQSVTIAADGSTKVNYYYTRNSYTVTLEKGTGIASVTGAGTYQYGESVTISAEVSDGYVWSKWSDDHTDQERIFTMGAEDISLTAQATPISYTITYDLGGGTVSGNPASYTVETDSFTLESPTRTGYTFAGWTGTDITGTSSTVTIPNGSTGDRTYTATWTANTYAITYAGMGGAQHGEDHPTTHTYDTDTLVPNPTKDGYAFAGWQINGVGDAVKDLTLSGTGYTANITLTAQWTLDTPAVDLTADKNSVTYGEAITLTATAAHTADGLTYTYQWYKDGTALSGKTESTLTLTDVADSGSYHVAVTASDSSLSSTVSSTPVAVEIEPLGIAVTWSGLTRVYGDTEPEVSAVLGGVLGNDACGLSAITYQQGDTSVAEPTNAGEYTAKVSLTGADAPNYTLKNGTATLTIRPKFVGFTVSGNAVEGDGTAKTATITPTDNTLTQTGYTVTYRQGTATVAAPTAVGSYEIWVEITDGNYQHTNGKTEMQVGTLTITQAPPVLYTVTFAGGEEADGTAPDALSAVANAKIILPESTFTRTNYQFTGWLYNSKVYQPGDSFTMPAQNVTFTAQWQRTYGITITVQEPKPEGEGTQTVSGAVVSLWLGANKLDEQTTGNDGEYTFAKLLPGIYNLVVTQGDRTVTTMVEITTSDVEETAALPKGATNSIVEVTPGSPDIVVGKLDTVFDKIDGVVYTQDDQDNVDAGGKVEITFTAEEKQKTEVSEDLRKIQTVSGESNLALVMDYKLEKEVFDAEGKKIDEDSKTIPLSNVLLEIRLPLPTELQGKAGYAVYRVHNDQAEAMKANPGSGEEGFKVEGSYITIYAQKFSTYAIGYTESSGNNNNNNNQASGGGGTSTPTYPPGIEEPEHGSVTISPKNPEKGDQVTITPTPDEGYTVDTVIVTGPNGKEVAVTPNEDGTYTFVQPSGKVTITVTFRQLASVSDCPRDESCPMAPFTDADRNAWYHDGVHYCVEHGLMMGTSQTTFAPDIVTTRGMIVTILWRLEGSPIVGASLNYDDVKAEDWYGEAVRWADSVGVVTGYGNGKFGPNDTITREQMAAMLWRYAGSPRVDGSLSSFTDGAQTSIWAQPAMIWAVEEGLITGVGNDRLEPRGQATRAQAATILMRFAQNMAQ